MVWCGILDCDVGNNADTDIDGAATVAINNQIELKAYKVSDLASLVARSQKFGTIYADPPWKYGNQATRASTDNHYLTMPTKAIAALPIRELAADDCHLHMWTTNAFLPESFAIMDGWGFAYKSIFVWCKPQIGLGNYWRVAHEFMLLGVKGKAKFGDRSLRSWQVFARSAHSEKPERIRDMIERTSPGPRLELFGRRSIDGWTVWGNEVADDLLIKAEKL